MDINNYINVPRAGVQSRGIPETGVKHAAVKAPVSTPEPEPVKIPETADKAAYESVRKAAEAVKTMFAVSDVRFTIFKDLAGDYVTRFTSLRDGTVKYFPQKSLFEMVQLRTNRVEGLFDAEA